jgi:hypothetical protein
MTLEDSTTALVVSQTLNGQSLSSLNLEPGATSSLVKLNSKSLIAAVAFDPSTKTLWELDLSGNIGTVNPANGAITQRGNTGDHFWTDAVSKSVPEPSTWVSSSIALLILAVCRCLRRRRTPSG